MITANKGMVKLEGTAIVLEGELMTIVRGFYRSVADKYGEDFAKVRLERVFKAAVEPDAAAATVPGEIKDLIQEILEDALSAIKGEEKEGEK